MQKLFSMFPRGVPGFALLLLRVFVAAAWASDALAAGFGLKPLMAALLLACACAVVLGFTTPIAAALASIVEAGALLTHMSGNSILSYSPIIIGVALALLGPGAFSCDARLFGRRLLEFGPHGGEQ